MSVPDIVRLYGTQFPGIGSGLPAHRNVPEVARYVNPDARVLWAGTGPVVVNHAQALLPGPLVAAVSGDVCRPEEILAAPRVRARLGFSQWRGRADRRSELIAIGQ